MTKNYYVVQYRPGTDGLYERESVGAYRVEAWTNDYAFFQNPKNLSEVTYLIPRSLVLRVEMELPVEQPSTFPPGWEPATNEATATA